MVEFSVHKGLRGLRRIVMVPAVLGLVIVSTVSADRRMNLPLDSEQIEITGEGHEALQVFFSNYAVSDSLSLAADIESLLMGVWPESYASQCEEIISHWGSDAANTPGQQIRAVYITADPVTGPQHILLAYRCFSYRDYYRDTYYDERLASLTIREDKSILTLLPHAWDCKNSLALCRITVGQIFQIQSQTVVSVAFSISGENPCCDGPFSCEEGLLNYYLFKEDGVKQVASVIGSKEEYYHDDVEGDTEVIYGAEVSTQENDDGDLVDIVSRYTIRENGELLEEGALKYIWNGTTEMFEEGIE